MPTTTFFVFVFGSVTISTKNRSSCETEETEETGKESGVIGENQELISSALIMIWSRSYGEGHLGIYVLRC